MKGTPFLYLCLLFSTLTINCLAQEEEFCCERDIMFAPVDMPAEQEYNSSGFIESYFLSGMNFFEHRFDCPIELACYDSNGREMLKKMIEDLCENMGYPPTQEETANFNQFKDLEYVFFSELHLDKIDTIESGYWEEGNEEEPNYVPANAYGDYSISIQLMNVQFNEKVWEGYNIWNGNSRGHTERLADKTTPNAISDLASRISPSIDKLIYDYERTPMNCNVVMDYDEVPEKKIITIKLTNLTDEKGRHSRPWQRVVIGLEKGEITNAVKSWKEGKKWVVLVGEQNVILKYKAPDIEQKEKETITIFNSCNWGQESIRPLSNTDAKKKLASKTFDIIPVPDKYEWNGRVTYELSTNFNCRHGTARIIEENKHQEQKADLKFLIDKLEFGLMNVGIIGKIEGNGQLEASIDDNREETGKDYHQIKQMYGSHTETISAQNIIITIVGKTEEDPKAMQERWQQMAQTDPMALIKEMKKMQEKSKDKNENLEIVITIIPPDPRKFTATYNVATNSKSRQERINKSVMMPLLGMSVKFDATLNFHEDGTAEITGGFDNPRYENNGKPSSTNCPPISVKEKVQFMLFKRKMK